MRMGIETEDNDVMILPMADVVAAVVKTVTHT